jgi:hypothetical protein
MQQALFLLALSGCFTTMAITKQDHAGVPLQIGAVVADVAVASAIAFPIRDHSVGARS